MDVRTHSSGRHRRGAILVAVVALAAAGPAYAADNKPTPSQGLACTLEIEGGVIAYPPGTEITVVVDGVKEVYVCTNGVWKKKTASKPRVVPHGTKILAMLGSRPVVAIR
jgi:hypothetical protein